MTTTKILHEIEKLSMADQKKIAELIIQHVHNILSPTHDLRIAAETLLDDYRKDPELTAFTALDAEIFHEAR